MNRRELLKLIAIATGATVVGAEFLLTGCKSGSSADAGFTTSNIALLDEVGETIIPATQTPGAKDVKIGEFMKTMVSDCYTEKQREAFTAGLKTLEEHCKKETGKSFMDLTPAERHDFLVKLEKEAKDFNKKRDDDDKVRKEVHEKDNSQLAYKDRKDFEGAPSHYYTMMKQLTLWGYFTSEAGMTKQLRFLPVPGRYDGNAPYVKGEKAWAE